MRLFMLGLVGLCAAVVMAASSRAEAPMRYRTLDKLIHQFATEATSQTR